jgi:hypothetical protein
MAGFSPELSEYLTRPMTPPDAQVAAALANPADADLALPLEEIDRLRDPEPLPLESGWCRLSDGVAFVAVRTEMPAVSREMVDWWFDWHPRDPIRYRTWFPGAHQSNSIDPPASRGAKPHWGAVHHPVEDIGVGMTKARIEFVRPTELGFATDALDDPAVATIVCGRVGDESRRVQVGVMAHVFLQQGPGVVLRSHFWLGSAIRPYAPKPIPTLAGTILNNRLVRRIALPRELPGALAAHCAAEYANFATLVPELFEAFGAADGRTRERQT